MRTRLGVLLALVLGVPGLLPHASARTSGRIAYTANETTATVSVIDTTTNTIIATIGLGSDPAIPGTPQPNGPLNGEADHHQPFYNGHVGTHGLWLSPDGSILLVANRISGTIVAIDTASNSVLGYLPVGREPHLATVRPGGHEAWVAVRGEDYVEVIALQPDDLHNATLRRTDRMKSVAKIRTMLGPSMVSFDSGGRFAFVAAGKQARVDKIDADSRGVVASQSLPAAFTPFGLVSPDNRELYLVHKGAGSLSVLKTSNLKFVVSGLPVGARANHIYFVGSLAYITIGGPAPTAANPDPEGQVVIFDRRRHAIVNRLTGPTWNGEPHGVWATPDGRLYIGHERGNRITVLNTGISDDPFDDFVEGTVTGSARDLGFMRGIIDIVIQP